MLLAPSFSLVYNSLRHRLCWGQVEVDNNIDIKSVSLEDTIKNTHTLRTIASCDTCPPKTSNKQHALYTTLQLTVKDASLACVLATRSLVSVPLAVMMSDVVVITLRKDGKDAGPSPPLVVPAPAPAKICFHTVFSPYNCLPIKKKCVRVQQYEAKHGRSFVHSSCSKKAQHAI